MKKPLTVTLTAILLVCILICTIVACTNGKSGIDFSMEVTEIRQTRDGYEVELIVDNYTNSEISFGWVNSCQIIVATEGRRYSFSPPWDEMGPGYNEITFLFDVPDPIQSITITDLRLLSISGLPGAKLSNVVIYDAAMNVNGSTGTFQSVTETVTDTIMIVLICLFVVGIALILVFYFLRKKKDREYTTAAAGFNPYAQQPARDTVNQSGGGFGPPPTL